MMLIGITGGIGSGKSSVGKFLSDWSYPVYNSDEWAKFLVENDTEIIKQITFEFGKEAYINSVYNRKLISEIVFNQPEKLEKINNIIHPPVAKHFNEWKEKQKSKIIFKESALLFELNLHKKCNKSLLVTASENIRITRVMKRDCKSYEEVKKIINKQLPESEKIKLADYIITNNEGLDNLEKSTLLFLKEIESIPIY